MNLDDDIEFGQDLLLCKFVPIDCQVIVVLGRFKDVDPKWDLRHHTLCGEKIYVYFVKFRLDREVLDGFFFTFVVLCFSDFFSILLYFFTIL